MSASSPVRSRRRKRDAVRRRVGSLRRRLSESRKRVRFATGVAVVASLVAVGSLVWPEPSPEPVLIGKGQAGVVTVSDRRVAPDAAPDAAPAAERPSPVEPAGAAVDSGEASYYAEEFEGSPTASGEPFASEGFTAAHRTLPLGSRLRVTNTATDESVVVRVNDRGPFAHRRVIDLSKAAAREIGMLQAGTARVRIELLRGTRS